METNLYEKADLSLESRAKSFAAENKIDFDDCIFLKHAGRVFLCHKQHYKKLSQENLTMLNRALMDKNFPEECYLLLKDDIKLKKRYLSVTSFESKRFFLKSFHKKFS